MLNRIALAIALASASSLAVAQTSSPPAASSATSNTASPTNNQTPSTPAVTAQPGKSTSATTGMPGDKGLSIANSATLAVKFVTIKPADFMTSKLVGANVYNNQNESLGEIEDLVVDNGRAISGVVVSVGGFLGIGESYVVLDPSTVVLNEKDGSWRAFVDTSKDTLKNAPKFKYTKKQS